MGSYHQALSMLFQTLVIASPPKVRYLCDVESLKIEKMCGNGDGGISECFTLSGWMKIVESFCIFTLIMIHRIGDSTKQVNRLEYLLNEMF